MTRSELIFWLWWLRLIFKIFSYSKSKCKEIFSLLQLRTKEFKVFEKEVLKVRKEGWKPHREYRLRTLYRTVKYWWFLNIICFDRFKKLGSWQKFSTFLVKTVIWTVSRGIPPVFQLLQIVESAPHFAVTFNFFSNISKVRISLDD